MTDEKGFNVLAMMPQTRGGQAITILVGALLVIALGWFGIERLIHIGKAQARAEYAEKITEVYQRLDTLKEGQASINTRLDELYRAKAAVVYQQGKTIIKKVPVYVPATTPDLPPGFRVLHDAATDGSAVPDAPDLSDGAGVPAQEATATVIDNYTGCRENALKVEGFQQWVREQRELSEKSHKELKKLLD